MTMQVRDTLIIEGEELQVFENPRWSTPFMI